MGTDKSGGRGCIGCALEDGKVCKDCTHEDDLQNECKEINAESDKRRELTASD